MKLKLQFEFLYFQDNQMRMQKLVDKLQSRVNVIMKGGGEKAVARHTSRGNSTTLPICTNKTLIFGMYFRFFFKKTIYVFFFFFCRKISST